MTAVLVIDLQSMILLEVLAAACAAPLPRPRPPLPLPLPLPLPPPVPLVDVFTGSPLLRFSEKRRIFFYVQSGPAGLAGIYHTTPLFLLKGPKGCNLASLTNKSSERCPDGSSALNASSVKY